MFKVKTKPNEHNNNTSVTVYINRDHVSAVINDPQGVVILLQNGLTYLVTQNLKEVDNLMFPTPPPVPTTT